MFIIGGADVDDNFAKRCTFFNRYKAFEEKTPMVEKRAFFPSIFCFADAGVYAFGGNDGMHDLNSCERFSLAENVWRSI